MKYVIIGNGAAGVAAAEKIRKLDKGGEIHILTSEKYDVYSKCLLPDFLSGQVSEERMFIRDKNFYKDKNIKIYYNHKVSNIDFTLKQIVVNHSDDIVVFSYDKLLIASGSTNLVPTIQGIDSINTHFLGTLDEAKKILEDAKGSRRIIIIGGGFVGLEAGINLYKNGNEVTLIEKTSRILMNQLDKRASDLIEESIQEEGIRLILNAGVSKVTSPFYSTMVKTFTGKDPKRVILEDGRKFKADMIIVAAGSKPNLDFLRNTKLDINKGILVDKHLETSIKDVYAAGDVVESIDAVTGKTSLSPIWPNAVIQGEIAGKNMAGHPQEFDSLISMQNASEFREFPLISMGTTSPNGLGYEEYVDYRPVDMIYRKIVVKDDIIVGMIFLGDIKNAGVIGALMKNKINVNKVKTNMLSPNFGYNQVSFLL